MARIAWNVAGSRYFESGVDRGVLYIDSLPGVPWSGLTSVEENPSGGEAQAYYIDGEKYLNVSGSDEFEATINAYTYPIEFSECDGTSRVRAGLFFGQQRRKSFGFSYRTMVGNDISGSGHAYKIHLVYNALASPSSRSASSFNDSVEASEFSWDLTTKSHAVSGYSRTAHVVVDSRYTHPVTMATIEDILYGTESDVARLPDPQELIEIFDTPVAFAVIDNGDGSYTIEGPLGMVTDIGENKYTIDHPGVVMVGEDEFVLTY